VFVILVKIIPKNYLCSSVTTKSWDTVK